jgi:hypothetical protein
VTSGPDPAAAPEPPLADGEPVRRRKRRWLRRLLVGIALTLVGLLLLSATLYLFGTMMPPSADALSAYDSSFPPGQAPPAEKRFHIPVPGCVCHSSDPALQVRHSTLYIRECSRCHGR